MSGDLSIDVQSDNTQVSSKPVEEAPSSPKSHPFLTLPFFFVLVANVFINAAYSLLSAFLPVEALSRGATQVEISIIFSMYSGTVMLASPFAGYIGRKVSDRTMLVVGLLIMAAAVFSMTSMQLLSGWQFLVTGITLRFIQGLGGALAETGAFTATLRMFPDEKAMASGVAKLETCASYGFILGPMIGGWSFQWGGFMCPFLVCGGMLALIAASTYLTLTPQSGSIDEDDFQWSVLFKPRLLALAGIMIFSYAACAFLDPALGPFLAHTFGFSPGQVGLVFASVCFIYSILAPISSWIAGKTQPIYFILVGNLVMVVAYILLGTPFGILPTTLVIVLGGLLMMNIGLALSLIPSMEEFVLEATGLGIPEALVSGMLPSAYSMSEIIGPIVGSAMTQGFSFGIACFFFSVGIAIASAVCLTLILSKSQRTVASASSSAETTPLLA